MSKCAARARRILIGAIAMSTVLLCSNGIALAATVGAAPDPLVFSAQRVATTSASSIVTLSNTDMGDDTSSLTLTIINDPMNEFAIVGTVPTGVAAGSTSEVSIEFTPAAAGARSALLEIAYATPSDTFTIVLQGTGTTAPTVTFDQTTPHTFADTIVGDTSAMVTAVVTNTGTETLTVTAVTQIGAGCARFTITTPSTPFSIPAATPQMTATFSPTARVSSSCTVRYTGNQTGSTTDFILQGSGIGPDLVLVTPPASIAFGTIRIGDTNGPTAFTLRNDGETVATVSSVAMAAFGTQYNLTGFTGGTIAAAATANVNVEFAPTLPVGDKNDNVEVVSDSESGTVLFPVTGRAAQRLVSVSDSSLPYGPVTVLTNSDLSFLIQNTGEAPLQISGMILSNTTDFSLVGAPGTPYTINGTSNQTITVRCRPTTAGAKAGTLTIASNGDNQVSTVVSLTCTGTKADITLTPNGDINFGNQTVGSTSAPTNVTISNANAATTETLVVSIVISGAQANNFNVTPASCRSPSSCNIAAGGSQVVAFTFTPSALNARNAVATFNSNDLETPAVAINLTGNGTRPEINVPTGNTETFPDQRVGTTSASETITATNAGNENLIISSATIIGTNAGDYNLTGPASVTLAPAASQNWTVTFTPTATGSRTATFSMVNNDPTGGENPKNVALIGTGTDANIDVTYAPLNFPETLVGFNSDITATIRNNGTASATITNPILSHAVFTYVAGPPVLPIVLAPGTQTTLDLRFTPVISSDVMGNLTVVSDDPNSPEAFPFIGPGRVAGMNVVPMAIDYGDIRIDGAGDTQTVTVSNNATGSLTLTSITLSNATDFSFSHPGITPIIMAPGADLVINVSTLPILTGSKTSDMTITATGVPSQVVSLVSVGVIPEIFLATPTLNFGPKDVQEVGVIVENAVLQNTGSDDLVISALPLAGPAAANYVVASSVSLPITVAPGDMATIPVEYSPTVANANHAATLTVIHDAPSMIMPVVLSGVAIDRFISVPMIVMFPDTQRNPEVPSTVDLPITNNGDALLDLTSVLNLTASDPNGVFNVVNSPDDVPGPASNTLNATLSFDPSSAGMFNGIVEIMSDDDTLPRVEVTVEGLGFVPRLAFTPMIVDFGRTGVGIPVRASETNSGTVRITNSEDFPLDINGLRVVRADGSAGPFVVLTALPQAPLAPGESLEVDLEYAPTESGNDTGQFEVLVNADDEPVGTISVRGNAVTVRLRGGGCSTSGDGTTWFACLLVLVVLGLRRRRLRAALTAVIVTAALGLLSSPTQADVSRNLDLRNFSPLPGVEAQMFSVETPIIGTPDAWSLSVFFNHAMNPLTVEADVEGVPDLEGMTDSPITGRTAAELAFSYAFGGKYEAGVLLSMLSQSGKDPLFSRLQPAEGTAIGDIALHGKALVMESGPLSLAASMTITLPTATKDQFAGADGPSTRARAILGIKSGRTQIAANAGFRVRGSSVLADVDQASELTYGAAGAYRVNDQLSAIVEMFGAFGMGGGASEGVTPLEATWGVRYRLNRQLGIAAGIGRGILPGIGAPEFRMFTLLSYSPQARVITPAFIPPPPPVIDRGDDDGDKIINEYDKCPKEAEDKDDFQDEDGCPDPDNDNDAIPDAMDKCPLKAEDKDGFKDGDGCPDLDNDKDGIPDTKDKCPNVPEDKDGFEDDDGCPEPDNDRDGIPDLLDQCATEPETINGNKDDDGCPDQGNSLVMLMPDRMEILKPIRFLGRSARISKRSHNVLGQVAAHLRARREFLRIRIAVHVHKRNRMDTNVSRRRAQAVRKWLISWGIEPERLDVKAYGSSRPLMRKNSAVARRTNNRVEFILLEKKIERRK